MEKYMDPNPPETISCTACMRDIPKSAAKSVESAGYTLYFCGLECYREWNSQAEKAGFKRREEHQSR